MFEIEYKGGNCVSISTKSLKLVSDPNISILGLKNVGVKDAIELATEQRFLSGSPDARLSIEGPGEYEIGDFSIRGIPALRHIDTESDGRNTTIYSMNIGEISLGLVGNIAANLTEDQLEAIGVVDILILPVGGGGYTLDGEQAARLARQIDPKVIFPVHYADKGISYEGHQDGIEPFLEEIGVPAETLDKYRLKNASALPPAMSVIVLKRI